MKKLLTKLRVISAVSKAQTLAAITTAARITPMTDITELAQSEINNALAQLKQISEYATPSTQYARVLSKYIATLVEALEKAQQRNGELETYSKTAIEFREAARDENRHLKLELEIAEKRIAELESRTVTVKLASRRLPSDYVDGEFGNDDLAATHNACRLECKVSVEKYLSAHGIVVKLEAE
ncbi:hypothetical protein U4Q03_22145 [Klebsiella pneumoniae]